MKVQKWFFIVLITCVMLMLANCGREPAADSRTAVGQDPNTAQDEDIWAELPIDNQSITELVPWQDAVGEWEDTDGLGYTMQISENDSETDMLFSISFTPHGGVFLDWVISCPMIADSRTLYYENGIMNYLGMIPGDNGTIDTDSSVEKNLVGSVSFDPDQDILSWYNGPKESSIPTHFVRSQRDPVEPLTLVYEGDENSWITLYQDGTFAMQVNLYVGYGKLSGTYVETESGFKFNVEERDFYGYLGDDVEEFELVDVGFGMVEYLGDAIGSTMTNSVYNEHIESESYDEFPMQESNSNGELSDAELTEINASVSSELAFKWKNAYNQSVSRDFRLSNVLARTIFPTIKRNGPIAAVITEVEFWFVKQGGSSAGSVYTVVIIDVNNGDVLSADITA